MASRPDGSLPKQHGDWADLKAAYRFYNNPKVTPDALRAEHLNHVRTACAARATILCVQDGSELDYSSHKTVQGLGFVGDGRGRGLLQHSSLAVTTEGSVLGVLHQIWWKRVRTPDGETRKQRRSRPKESDLWGQSMRAVAALKLPCRVIHVCDRGADIFETMHAAREQKEGFLIRAEHDRCVEDGREKLWAMMQRQPVLGTRVVEVSPRSVRGGRPAQPRRTARCALRFAPVRIPPPRNDPRFQTMIAAWAVYLIELDPPAGMDPIEWMLLTSEPVEDLDQANTCMTWYTFRWRIEEWHKAVKSGCRLEAAQFETAEAIERLATMVGIVAVRMLQLRDAAQTTLDTSEIDDASPSEQPHVLQAMAPWEWIVVVSWLARCAPESLTPRLFWRTIARRGGFIGRKSDGHPGWQTIWRGWSEIAIRVEAFEAASAHLQARKSCG